MMNTGYVDKNLIQNSALACFILTEFVLKYEHLTLKTESPDLMKLLLVLPIVWHKSSCQAIIKRNFSTPLHAVISTCPSIKNQFQERLAEFSPISCQGLNLAYASGLLHKTSSKDKSCFSAAFESWPRGSKPNDLPQEMIQAINRLAVWFKDAQTAELYNQFLGI
jgi:hypothetical protein